MTLVEVWTSFSEAECFTEIAAFDVVKAVP